MDERAQVANSPVAIGETLAGKYRIDRILGQGGMGIVVAATHLQLRQKVAIKFLLKGARDDIVARFLREARAAARLKSEHVARVLDVGELPNGSPFMVMEYLEGSDLEGVMESRGPLPIAEAVLHLLQACEAMAEAHAAGIVHRDLKPANLFLTRTPDGSSSVKVLDFGISKDTAEEADEASPSLTRTTAVLGSPSYMAPEQMRSTRDVDARADIWSLGIILYELVTGTVPFDAESFVELALKVISDEPLPPSTHRPDLPPALETAILRAIQKDPTARFASVTEFALAIAPFGAAIGANYAERVSRVQGIAPQLNESILPAIPLAATQTVVPQRTGTISAGWAEGGPPTAAGRSKRTGVLLAGGMIVGLAMIGGVVFALRSEAPAAPATSTPSRVPAAERRPAPDTSVALADPSPAEEEAKPEADDATDDPPSESAAAHEAAAQDEVETTELAPASEPKAPQKKSPAPERTPASTRPTKAPKPAPEPEKPQEAAPAPPRPEPKPAAPSPKRNPLDMDIQ